MGKRTGKRRSNWHGSGTGNISGSGGVPEQYLTPGSPERERMLSAQEDLRDALADGISVQPDKPDEKPEKKDDGSVGTAYQMSQGSRNYRNFMKKYEQVGEARAIVEDGLGHSVSRKDLDDELYDPQVDASGFKAAVVADHAAEFQARRETPVIDTNGDGKVDAKDDVIMTPGMRRMARYM